MQEYILRLCKELERQQLWDKESRLLLAVSGGADSMALLGLVQPATVGMATAVRGGACPPSS